MDFPLTAINYVSGMSRSLTPKSSHGFAEERGLAACNCVAQVLILGVFTKYLAVTVPFVFIIVILIQRLYLRTSRQVRLLDIEAKAPVFLQFVETTSGAATIRAFGWQQHFRRKLDSVLDRSQRPVYLLYSIQRWLALILDLLVAVLAILLVSIVVTWKSSFDSGAVGLSLVMVMVFNKSLMSVVRFWTMLETSIGAVSRIKKFVEGAESEDRGDKPSGPVPQDWPTSGAVKFSDVAASHR